MFGVQFLSRKGRADGQTIVEWYPNAAERDVVLSIVKSHKPEAEAVSK